MEAESVVSSTGNASHHSSDACVNPTRCDSSPGQPPSPTLQPPQRACPRFLSKRLGLEREAQKPCLDCCASEARQLAMMPSVWRSPCVRWHHPRFRLRLSLAEAILSSPQQRTPKMTLAPIHLDSRCDETRYHRSTAYASLTMRETAPTSTTVPRPAA